MRSLWQQQPSRVEWWIARVIGSWRDDRRVPVDAGGVPEILAHSVLLRRVHLRVGHAYFAAAKAGRLVGVRATIACDVAAAKAKAEGLFRVWSTVIATLPRSDVPRAAIR